MGCYVVGTNEVMDGDEMDEVMYGDWGKMSQLECVEGSTKPSVRVIVRSLVRAKPSET